MPSEIRLRRCQERARDEILHYAIQRLNERDYSNEWRHGLIAPTGSGKTVILGKTIKKISQELNKQVAFIWLSISKGDLANQSIQKLRGTDTFPGLLNQSGLSILSVDDIKGATNLAGSVLVLNWDVLNKVDKEGKPINIQMKDGDFQNFPAICEVTSKINIPIVLIIDESHTYAFTDKSLNIRNNIIKPAFTLEVSATPKEADWDSKTRIKYAEAQKAGLIKNDIHCSTFLSTEDGIQMGVDKVQGMIELAKNTGVGYNPRLLVFMPNAETSNGSDELDNVLQLLKDKYNLTEDNGDVVVWMSKRKSKDYEKCKENLSNCKVILTKEAIDTGVDIPSVQVIVQLRPISSAQVQVQKIGRGLRMPFQEHYGNELDRLNYYVFNDAVLDFKDLEDVRDQINRKHSVIRPEFVKYVTQFPKLKLSFYTRKSPLREAEDKEFQAVFGPIFTAKLRDFTSFNVDKKYTEETKSGSLNLDEKKAEYNSFAQSDLKEDYVAGVYVSTMRTKLKHMYKHSEYIEDYIGELLQNKDQYDSFTYQQVFTLNNMDELMRMVFESLDEGEEQVGKNKELISRDYVLPSEYFIDADVDASNKKHLHDKYFLTGKTRSEVESAFEAFLEKDDRVVWWQKNYARQISKSYSVCYGEDGVFYPDYILALNNGKYLIIDTTTGTIDANKDEKRKALVASLNGLDNILGGIVRQEHDYFYFQGAQDKPILLTDLFK